MSNAQAFDHAAYRPPVDFQTPGADYRFTLPTHPAWIGYVLWVIGFTGAHRFYFGRPLTGILWFFTGGLFLIGWIVDLFLIQSMANSVDGRYPSGRIDYGVAWLLHIFLGLFGIHRFYMGKIVTGVIYLCTGGLFGIGYVYDTLTLNDQIAELNHYDI
jgi:TM2 domain-containing membrane protein YozV